MVAYLIDMVGARRRRLAVEGRDKKANAMLGTQFFLGHVAFRRVGDRLSRMFGLSLFWFAVFFFFLFAFFPSGLIGYCPIACESYMYNHFTFFSLIILQE